MTKEQRNWLMAHPEFDQVHNLGITSLHEWRDEGWLYPNGRFESAEEAKGVLHSRDLGFPTGEFKVGRKFQRP